FCAVPFICWWPRALPAFRTFGARPLAAKYIDIDAFNGKSVTLPNLSTLYVWLSSRQSFYSWESVEGCRLSPSSRPAFCFYCSLSPELSSVSRAFGGRRGIKAGMGGGSAFDFAFLFVFWGVLG